MKKTIKYFASGIIFAGLITLAACSKDDELPKIDGYNNSNEVAATNLKAHWTFDDTNNESISVNGSIGNVWNGRIYDRPNWKSTSIN